MPPPYLLARDPSSSDSNPNDMYFELLYLELFLGLNSYLFLEFCVLPFYYMSIYEEEGYLERMCVAVCACLPCVHVCMYVSLCACVCICVHACVSVCMCVSISLCVSVCPRVHA